MTPGPGTERGAAEELTIGTAPTLRGEAAGEGTPVVLCHGLTASRRYVIHGSRVLERRGMRTIAYDARGHGESDPAPASEGYGYPALVADLQKVIASVAGEGQVLLAGHSMGAHTALALALREPGRVGGLVVAGPAYARPAAERELRYWDGLADALEQGGVEAFVAYIERHQGAAPAWRDSVRRFTRQRMLLHRDLGAVAAAIREVSRSRPFDSLADLQSLDVPALVVGSRDEPDPGHPYEVAAAYAERLPRARLIVEGEGESPIAWRGGVLAREIAAFATEPEVAARLAGGTG